MTRATAPATTHATTHATTQGTTHATSPGTTPTPAAAPAPTAAPTPAAAPTGRPSAIIGVLGSGVTGRAVGRVAQARGMRLAWYDVAIGAAVRACRQFGGVVLDSVDDLGVVDVVVLAAPVRQGRLAASLLADGRSVVSLSDDPRDVDVLLGLHDLAVDNGARLVVGAAVSPGLSGVLARHAAATLAVVDEIHVATHGTGGPACARRHHDALGTRAVGWHDGEWTERPGGSGRELCWFPEPIGAADCYRAALADPLVLHEVFPDASRISARVSATRRDRFTSRLPMLTPPHSGGDRGAVRVEVRGADEHGARVTNVVGAVGRTGDLAGVTAALFAQACLNHGCEPGVVLAGADLEMSRWLLGAAIETGVMVQEFTGVARATAW